MTEQPPALELIAKIKSSNESARLPLRAERILVGSGEEVHVRMEAPGIHVNHAEIFRRGDGKGYELKVSAMSPPFLLDGSPCVSVLLKPGLLLDFGAATLECVAGREAPAAPTPEPDPPTSPPVVSDPELGFSEGVGWRSKTASVKLGLKMDGKSAKVLVTREDQQVLSSTSDSPRGAEPNSKPETVEPDTVEPPQVRESVADHLRKVIKAGPLPAIPSSSSKIKEPKEPKEPKENPVSELKKPGQPALAAAEHQEDPPPEDISSIRLVPFEGDSAVSEAPSTDSAPLQLMPSEKVSPGEGNPFVDLVREESSKVTELSAAIEQAASDLETATRMKSDLIDQVRDLKLQRQRIAKEVASSADEAKRAAAMNYEAARNLARLRDHISTAEESLGGATREKSRLEKALKTLRKEETALRASLDEMRETVKTLRDEVATLGDLLKKRKRKIDEVEKHLTQLEYDRTLREGRVAAADQWMGASEETLRLLEEGHRLAGDSLRDHRARVGRLQAERPFEPTKIVPAPAEQPRLPAPSEDPAPAPAATAEAEIAEPSPLPETPAAEAEQVSKESAPEPALEPESQTAALEKTDGVPDRIAALLARLREAQDRVSIIERGIEESDRR